jgi:hypothetical protein
VSGVGANVSDVELSPADAFAGFQVSSTGVCRVSTTNTSGYNTTVGTWLNSGTASSYEWGVFNVNDLAGGSNSLSGVVVGNWYNCATTRAVVLQETGTGFNEVEFDVRWRNASTREIVATSSVRLEASVEL